MKTVLLGHDEMQFGRQVPTFQWNVQPPSSTLKQGGIRLIQNFETYILNCIVFQRRRPQSSETDCVSLHTLKPYLHLL
jgi:hypothetical protein